MTAEDQKERTSTRRELGASAEEKEKSFEAGGTAEEENWKWSWRLG